MHLLTLGFVEAKSNASLFVFRREANMVYLLLYVDNIVGMMQCKDVTTPLSTSVRLSAHRGVALDATDVTKYHSVVGALQ
jgi:hypothetical protein